MFSKTYSADYVTDQLRSENDNGPTIAQNGTWGSGALKIYLDPDNDVATMQELLDVSDPIEFTDNFSIKLKIAKGTLFRIEMTNSNSPDVKLTCFGANLAN